MLTKLKYVYLMTIVTYLYYNKQFKLDIDRAIPENLINTKRDRWKIYCQGVLKKGY